MADGAEGIDSLANAVIKLTGEVSEMRGEMRSFMDHKLAAEQRVEIRAETESMIEKAVQRAADTIASQRATEVEKSEGRARAYADAKIRELEARLAVQEERDSKREGQMQRQQIAMGGMVVVILAYAVIQALGGN